MNTQPKSRSDVEALRLAKILEKEHPAVPGARTQHEAAAELRRLHARELHYEMIDHQNKLLHALNQELITAIRPFIDEYRAWTKDDLLKAMARGYPDKLGAVMTACAAIAKAEGQA